MSAPRRNHRPSSPTPRLPADSLAFALAQAAAVIVAVIKGRNLDGALAAAPIPATTRPAVQDIAYSTLRDYGRGDFILAQLLRSPLTDPAVHALLLAALMRLEVRPDDAHTTVDQAVHAAQTLSAGRLKALVNAVLRNFLRQRDALLAAADDDAVAHHRHPRWWIDILAAAYPAQWTSILAAGNQRPPMSLRVNRRRSARDVYLAALAEAGIGAEALVVADQAIRLLRPVTVDRLPAFAEGHASVQDAAAQQAARLLGLSDGLRVLDACAAPGGKAAQMLETAAIDLLALEADGRRAERIHENLNRLGLTAAVTVSDCRAVTAWWDGRPFDRILADVPCSASGVVRRHPDAKWLRRPEDIGGFATVQAEILDALWPTLKPGGRMLYCTCSVFPQENRQQVDAFVNRHADARRLPTGDDGALDLQLLPTPDHDGLYYALLEKAC